MSTDAAVLPRLEDYASSRRLLLDAGAIAGGVHEAHPHPRRGPSGEPLATDVLRFGAPPDAARTVVVITSGTHGVEGHAGWGLQQLTLAGGRLATLDPGVAVVLIHAVNPYGMAWSRRVDDENIDVNRNFVDFAKGRPSNESYDAIDAVLNPAELDPDDTAWQDELRRITADMPFKDAYRAISGGQYDRPGGVQFGGQGASWSTRTLHAIWSSHLANARTVLHLDLHTGLGPCGRRTIFQTADATDASAEVAATHFPTVMRFDRPVDHDGYSIGVLGPGLEAALGTRDDAPLVVPVVVEFGTLPDVDVLGAMRADNWLHQHGDPASALGHELRAQTRAAFFVDDPVWLADVAQYGLESIDAALDATAEHPAA